MRVAWEVDRLTPPQRDLLTWNAPPGTRQALTGALSVSYGTAKSTAAMLRFARVCMEHPPWNVGSHRRQPLALALAPTYPLLKINVLDLAEYVFPRQVVLRKMRSPPQEWTLINGVKIVFMSGDGQVDSGNAFCILVDEVSYPQFLDPSKWRKIVGRLRYPSYRELIVTGISSSNPLIQERFYRPDDPAAHILTPGLEESPIDDEAKANILSTVPYEYQEAALRGGWAPDRESIYTMTRELHSVGGPLDKSRPALVSMDPGKSAAAAVFQQYDGGVLVCVDEAIAYDTNTEGLCQMIADRGWAVQQVAIDPNANMDCIPLIRRVFPSATVVAEKKRTADWLVESGIEKVRTALRDANGKVRLKFHETLWDGGHPRRGIVRSMLEYRYGPGGKPVRDDRVDHQVDVVRYGVLRWVQEPELTHRRRVRQVVPLRA